MAELNFGLLAQRVAQRVERLLVGAGPRVVGVHTSGLRVDPTRTTADDARARRIRARGNSSLLWDPYQQTRAQRYADYREMEEEVPELDRSLTVRTDFVFGGAPDDSAEESFDLRIAERARPEVRRVLDNAVADIDLHHAVRPMFKAGLKLGDAFAELVYTDGALVWMRPLRPEWTTVREDEFGRLAHYLVAGGAFDERLPLHPFQVLHFAPNAPWGSRYGRSIWASGRGVRRQHEAILDVLAILALRKASGDEKILWPFAGEMDSQSVWDWIREVQASMEDDLFFDGQGDLRKRVAQALETFTRVVPYKVLDGLDSKPTIHESKPANLLQLLEVARHHQERFFITSGTPAALAGMERNVNARATVAEQGVAFALTVRNDQRDAAELVVDVLTRALLAADVVPEPDEWYVVMPPPSQLYERTRAEVRKIQADTVKTLVEAGAPLRFALVSAYGLDEAEAERVLAEAPGGAERTVERLIEAAERVWTEGQTVKIDGAARAALPQNQPPARSVPSITVDEAVKPKLPEAPADAPFGQYAWAARREAMPDEPDNAAEDRVFEEMKAHFASRNRKGLPKATAEMLRGFLEKGWYKAVIHAPPQDTLYRGLRLYGSGTDTLKAILGPGVEVEEKTSGSTDYTDGHVVRRKNGWSTSWSAQKKATAEFSTTGREAGWRVTLHAKPGAKANANRFIAGPGGLYDVDGLSKWHLEKESVGLEPITVFKIEWEYLPYQAPAKKKED